jgi:two-component system LytT family sensor kinase
LEARVITMSGPAPVVGRLTRFLAVRVLLAIFAWTAIGFLFALPGMTAANWREPLFSYLGLWWSWGLMTPLILALDRRLPFGGKELNRRVKAHAVASLVFTAVYLYVYTASRAAMGVIPWSSLRSSNMFAKGMFGLFLWSLLVYWVIVGALQAYRYYERYMSSELRLERLEKSYSQARLNALRMQLDPHFLFNALNTISSEVERDPKLTRRMIEHLGDLLRMSLESKDRQEVPLAEELAFLDHYLAIQRIRFGNQLKIEFEIAHEVRYASVPCLFLQPLVENAIRHGISRRASGGTVTVTAEPVGGRLAIRILDDGVGLPPGWSMDNAPGLGLSVTRERIGGLYPNGLSRFTVRRRVEGGTAVEILLPLELMGEDPNGCSVA